MPSFKEFFSFSDKKKENKGNSEKPVENITGQKEQKMSVNLENPKQKKYFVAGHEVILEENQLIPEQPEEGNNLNEIKQLIRNLANSPKLSVFDKGGRQISGAEFDAWRKEIYDNPQALEKLGQSSVLEAAKQNYFTRASQIGSVIENLLKNNSHYEEWKRHYDGLKVDTRDYNQMNAAGKENLAKSLDKLILDIYNNL